MDAYAVIYAFCAAYVRVFMQDVHAYNVHCIFVWMHLHIKINGQWTIFFQKNSHQVRNKILDRREIIYKKTINAVRKFLCERQR
jgi:hypothetical protein